MYALSRERIYNLRLGNDVFTASCCSRIITIEPLSRNRRLCCAFLTAHFRLSGRTSQYRYKDILIDASKVVGGARGNVVG
jgi:hypothetical protein